jgi:hypothetical protein
VLHLAGVNEYRGLRIVGDAMRKPCGSSDQLVGLVNPKQSTRDGIRKQHQGCVVILSVHMAVVDPAECDGNRDGVVFGVAQMGTESATGVVIGFGSSGGTCCWGETCCPIFPDQFRWFGLTTLFVVNASYRKRRHWRKRTKKCCRCLGVTRYGKNPNPQPALSRSDGEGLPDLLSDQQQSWKRTQSAL